MHISLNQLSKSMPDGNAYDSGNVIQIPNDNSLIEVAPSGDLRRAGELVNVADLLESSMTLDSFGALKKKCGLFSVKRDTEVVEVMVQKDENTKTTSIPYVNRTMVGKIKENPLMVSRKKPALITEVGFASDPRSSYASESTLMHMSNSSAGLSSFLAGKDHSLRRSHWGSYSYLRIDKKTLRLSPLDREILSARKEISHASFVENVNELYMPLFHNLSVFKRYFYGSLQAQCRCVLKPCKTSSLDDPTWNALHDVIEIFKGRCLPI